jgi:hypothetical protein
VEICTDVAQFGPYLLVCIFDLFWNVKGPTILVAKNIQEVIETEAD